MRKGSGKETRGMDILGDDVPVHQKGSLVQVVPGDPTNEEFEQFMKADAEKFAEKHPDLVLNGMYGTAGDSQ